MAIILWISLFLGDTILQLFGISIDSFRIAGGILGGDDSDVDDRRRSLAEDKQNKQEKSETAVRESIGVVPLALPLMAGPGRSVLPSSGVRVITALAICLVSLWLLHCSLYVAGIVPHGTVAGTGFTPNRHQRDHARIMGLLLMALGIEFIVTGIKGFSRPA
ncbi:NAAT family transporter [Escherichia coli]|nr:NAAT family transporter [Escherichia coli]